MTTSALLSADDFGLDSKANHHIKSLLKERQLALVSLLVNFPHSSQAVIFYRQFPTAHLGLHANLTQGSPISIPQLIPSLVDKKGRFFPLPIFLLKLLLGQLNLEDIITELENQLNYLTNKKLKTYHLNSHQNIHLFPPLIPIFQRISEKHHLQLRQTDSVYNRLKYFPIRFLVFEVFRFLLHSRYPKTPTHITGSFKETLIHPGTNYDNLHPLISRLIHRTTSIE